VVLPEDPAAARAAAETATTLDSAASPALARALEELARALQPGLPVAPQQAARAGLGARFARLFGRGGA
jgi:NADPH-dependent ferric siderophore reductase